MKILQVVMNLEYGGVESYIVRLSRALKQLRHEVTVLSGGGPLEKLLQDSGIEFITASLKHENLTNVLAMLQGRTFDVINGHNYNSARAAHAISDAIGVPYVMTVHGPRPFLKRITYKHWSPRVITTSEADTRGIMGFMGVPRDRIERTFLPIDPDLHCPREAPEALRRELLPEGGRLIVHVSRFTNRKAQVALELLKAMPGIIEKCSDARLFIAGAGECFGQIAQAWKSMDKGCRDMVTVQGPRDDVEDLCNLASVMIATATTATEALACGAPLIAAGRTGYFGPVDCANFDAAFDLLFADHGVCPHKVTAEALERDVTMMLRNENESKAEALELAKRVAEEFSPMRAAGQVIDIYGRVMQAGAAR